MNTRRLMIALLVALLLSGAATFYLSRRLTNRGAAPDTVRYVAAARPLQSGEELKPESLVIVDWPTRIPLEGAFTKIEDLTGRSVIYPITTGQPILASHLALPGSGIGLSVKIQEGMRAVSVRSDEVVGVAGFLFPGSHVDVLVTLRSDRSPTPMTQIVLQDAEVLTAGQNIEPDPQGKPQTVNVVTLLLKPEDTQKLVLACSQGSIEFVLRNGADRGHVKAVPMQIASLSGSDLTSKTAPQNRPQKLKADPPYVVEVIAGDKHARVSFESGE